MSPVTLESRSPWLLGCCWCQLCKSCAGANTLCSWAECVLVFEHYFVLKSFDDVCEAFSSVYPDKEVSNKKSVHPLVTTFWYTWSVCKRKHCTVLTGEMYHNVEEILEMGWFLLYWYHQSIQILLWLGLNLKWKTLQWYCCWPLPHVKSQTNLGVRRGLL
jgi:hypothetical protein